MSLPNLKFKPGWNEWSMTGVRHQAVRHTARQAQRLLLLVFIAVYESLYVLGKADVGFTSLHIFGRTRFPDKSATRALTDQGITAAATLKEQVIKKGAELQRGTSMTAKESGRFRELLLELAALNPTSKPAEAWGTVPGTSSLLGKWELVWSDAPDVARPESVKTEQEIALDGTGRRTITNIVEVPLPWGTVELGVETLAMVTSSSEIDLKIRGIDAKKSDSWPWFVPFINIFDLIPKSENGSPFGSFQVLYLDESLRITKTNSGYYAVNKRI
eukprot:TRINITY_DN113203_c0_g1_i1.p1 TRINITY_DN113203_c0_g1~~TRINITY_DN113203_c0_g1_i1.p1  ORF type:complete len:280 (+),score=18.86 TRINITY_DN113203_c0_g1_i1:23-841(+)